MKYQFRTFKDLIDGVCEQLKIQSSDTESRRRIRRNLNTVYLSEVVPFKRWQWLRNSRTLQTEPYFASGTASVTQNSVSVTLSTAPSTSKKGYLFSTSDSSETYRIASHVAGSTTLQLETPYSCSTAAASTYKIWTDAVPLPTDCKEVTEVTHNYLDRPLDNFGLQEFRRITITGPKAEGRPRVYTTTAFKDPDPFEAIEDMPASVSRSANGLVRTVVFASDVDDLLEAGDQISVSTENGNYSYNGEVIVSSVDGTTLTYTSTTPLVEASTADTSVSVLRRSTESYEAYRELLVYPALSDKRTTLHVDYQVNAEPLENDSDEPLMPLEDRNVLFYGAMWLSCDRERNPEWANQNYQLFQAKLSRMAGKTEDSPDKPIIKASNLYIGGKRMGARRRDVSSAISGWGGGSGGSTVTGTAETVAIFNENGELVGSADIDLTALNFLAGAQGGLSEVLSANVASATELNSWNATTYKHVHVHYGIVRGSAFSSGLVIVTSDGSSVSYTDVGSASVGDTGITLSADISAGQIRLLYTSDGSGPSANFVYKVHLL